MTSVKRRGLFKCFLAIALAVVLAVSLPLPFLPAGRTEAAGTTQNVANLVIFVKYGNDNKDIFNATSGTASNWKQIKQMYEDGIGYGNNDSFRSFISAVTEDRINVTNFFPQERSGKTGVDTLKMTINSGSEGTLVKEVIDAFNRNQIQIDTDANKLDNLQSGVIDNLTIIVQGKITGGKESAFHSTYAGEGRIHGLCVGDYNIIPSSDLVWENPAEVHALSEQGVIAHEFLHTLGLPDLYRQSGDGQPVGIWDIMASVSCFLQYPLSYLRARQGWITMGNITQSGTYTLTAASEQGDGTKVFALRTPLSDTEFICLEYRRQGGTATDFDYRIPASGLLMYRVDNKVPYLSNHSGQNYIYVYRPGVTDPEAGTDKMSNGFNLVHSAALEVKAGASYGTTDLGAHYTKNTLYYSDGSNSGIKISDLKLSSDGTKLTFTVTFADYNEAISWEKLGDSVSSQSTDLEPVICTDPSNGTLYAAYSEDTTGVYTDGRVCVKRWNGTTWQQVGTAISHSWDAQLAFCGGELYLSCIKERKPVYYKLENGVWTPIAQHSVEHPKYMRFVVDGSDIYGAYESSGRWLIYDLKSGKLANGTNNTLTATDFSNPAILKSNGCFYLVYSDKGAGSKVMKYDSVNGWSTAYTISSQTTNLHQIKKVGQKIYAFAGCGDGASTGTLAVFDGSSWSSNSVSAMKSYNMMSMDMVGSQVCLAYYDVETNKGNLLQGTGSAFQTVSDKLGTGLAVLKICTYGNTVYAATRALNTSNLVIRKMTVSGTGVTPSQPETQEKRTVVLAPPAGYGGNQIYIDGVEYTAAKSGSNLELKLSDTSAKTAVMYSYDAKGIPVGMYVWKLSWTGEVCKAVPLPGLQNLLSYHGFSIRIQGKAGLRFKSGIDAGVKQRLIAGSVDGCRLKEYGSLFITNENRNKYPFVKDGTKVGGGRAYWTENGKTNDKVFETVGGRNRFTSVLVNLSPNMYAKDISFRAYAVLVCDGQELIVYGPPVYKSVYTVAKQVQARGEFKPGSSGYQYIQGIINSVEGQ